MQVPGYIFGSIAPTFTVFNDDGSLDDDGQRNLLDFLLETGAISAFFIRSGMGQMYTFSVDDTKQIARTACAHLKGRAPVLIGCSGEWDRNYDRRPDPVRYLEQGLELGRFAEDQGADGIVYTMPEALVPKKGQSEQDLIVAYFEALTKNVSTPVLIYQPPKTQPAYCVDVNLIVRLAQMPSLMGMKVSSSDGAYLFDLIRAVKDETFGFIVGAETVFYAGCLAGARACIGQGATLNPQVIRAIVDRYVARDLAGAVAAQEDANSLVRWCPNAVDFTKSYAIEKGYKLGAAARTAGPNPYGQDRGMLSQEDYGAFKKIYEATLAAYA